MNGLNDYKSITDGRFAERIRFEAVLEYVGKEIGFFGAQPGAGKSVSQSRIRDVLSAQDGTDSVMMIGTDLYRPYHPAYQSLMGQSDETMALLTNPDASKWTNLAISYSQHLRPHVLLEGTLKNPPEVQSHASRYVAEGFSAHLHIIAVHELVSRTRAIGRYLEQVAHDGSGRFVPSAVHDATYAQIPSALSSLLESEQFTSATRYDLNGDVLIRAEAPDAQTKAQIEAVLAMARDSRVEPAPLVEKLDRYRNLARRYERAAVQHDIEVLIDRLSR
ncbi:hypothetical protein EK0264_15845 [Epidermidibacterium keratini]|uniref:UDP-N-acetylglucosamine kinase n=1 Tax=Epidermidibacterium keratini TaxID=1891644 RepID=A0A7L4YR40_9ACTN|nr:zeta toxin family protein [Epidermidibacterium keratini]QHC01616.1 hypothetical protein EK0264_15845 [Epidermidibacterium keratini]